MHTPNISQAAESNKIAASVSAKSNSDQASTSFSDMLSKEVGDRSSSTNVSNDTTNQTSNAQAPSKAPSTDKSGSDSSDDGKVSGKIKDDKSDTAQANAADPSTQMLTLVANAQQILPTQAVTKAMAPNITDAKSLTGKTDLAPIERGFVTANLGKPDAKSDLKPELKATIAVKPDSATGDVPTSSNTSNDVNVLASAQDQTDSRIATKTIIADAPVAPALQATHPSETQATVQVAFTNTVVAAQHSPVLQQAAGTVNNERLTPPVGTNAWDQALGQKVVWMVAGGQQSASLTLNPPDLGPLQVVLNVNNSHASASFTAAQPEVRQAIEAALPKLREMMGEAGIQLGQTSVSAGSHQQQTPDRSSSSQSAQSSILNTSQDTNILVPVARRTQIGTGLVDTFV